MSQPLSSVILRPGHFARLVAVSAIFLLSQLPGPARAAWSNGNWTEVFTSTAEVRELSVASDAAGGTLVMYLNQGLYPARSAVSRLSRTGSELWGTDGKIIPFNINTTNQVQPVAVAPDGSGGAYCLWSEWYSVSAVLRLGHFDSSAALLWVVDIASAGSNPGTTGAQLVLEPGTGVTVGYADSSSQRLYARRYDSNGSLLWATDVNQFYEHNVFVAPVGGYTEFDMQPDGLGGVLFAWYRYDLAQYQTNGVYFEQIGAQRVDSAGNALWGADGHMVWKQPGFWHTSAYHARIVDDGAGGAYVITSGGLRTYGQHLNSSGAETWAANGIVLQATDTATWNTDTEPEICRDGAGGLFLVQTRNHVYAQHVDINGSLLFGTAGIVAASVIGTTEYFSAACIDEDGFGGAVVGWHRWDSGAESVGGLRFDGFGTVLWNDKQLFDASGGDEIQDIHIVGDDVGGAQYVWKRHVPGPPARDDVYALGVNAQGLVPVPVLYGLVPDAAQPGEIIPALLFGDYLDDTYGYELRNSPGQVPFTGLTAYNAGLVGGWFDFTGAATGAWDLYATLTGTDRATLADAFGVGLPPSCPDDEWLATQTTADNFGTRRKMAFDSGGNCRFAYLEYDPLASEFVVARGINDGVGTSIQLIETIPGSSVIDLAYTVDATDRDVIAYVTPGPWANYLVSRTFDATGSPVPWLTVDLSFTPTLSNPVLAPMPNGDLHIIFEEGSGGVKGLFSLLVTPGGVLIPPLSTGTNSHSPDVVVTPDGLAMVYIRDSWFPGVSEVCLQHLRNGTWEAPQVISFALSLTSPSVAFDGNTGLLMAWIVDNSGNGSDPLLQTCLLTNDVAGPVRTRAADGTIFRVQVDAQGPGDFYMLTEETGQPMQFFLRSGDGNVFYPRRRLNSVDDSDWPLFAAEHGGTRLGAMWQSYSDPLNGSGLMGWFCNSGVSTAAPATTPTVLSSRIQAHPNPFNPRTSLVFALGEAQWAQLQILDLRGRRVRTVWDGPLPAGEQEIAFDGRDDQGVALASGTYFALLRPSLDVPRVVKLTLLK